MKNSGFFIKRNKNNGLLMATALLGLMLFDQFVVDLPFENVVFALLVISAYSLPFSLNLLIVAVYSVLFELSCVAWFPFDLVNVKWWLLATFVGYFSVYFIYKAVEKIKKPTGIISLSVIASVGELVYFQILVVATCIIWKTPYVAYLLSDLPYELVGIGITFFCSLPVFAIARFGERKRKTELLTI